MLKKITPKWNFIICVLTIAITCFLYESIDAKSPRKNIHRPVATKSGHRRPKTQQRLIKKNNHPIQSRSNKKRISPDQPKKSIKSPSPQPLIEENEKLLHSSLSVKNIRVLLNEYELGEEKTFDLQSSSGFVLESPVKSNNCAIYQTQNICLRYNEGRLHLRCKDGVFRRVKHNSLEVCNSQNKLSFGKKTYQGSLIFVVSNQHKKVLVINKLPFEDYVCSVVGCESTPSWPLAFQKVQAIISRTYALHQMQFNRNKKDNQCVYDIRNTNHHQVYDGYNGLSKVRQAVNETAGLIVTYKNNVAFTEFDVCCGGVQTNRMRKIDRSKPYVCKATACPYCHASPFYSWKIDQHINSLSQALCKHPALKNRLSFISMKNPLTDIKVADKDAAGIVYKIRLSSKNGRSALLTGYEFKRCFSDNRMKSYNFSIKKIKDRIVINGKGYGHQRGICQWGCKELIDRGWQIKKILSFYYPGTQLKRLVT